MPIRPELRPYYGAQHRAYRRQLIELLGARCMSCGREGARYLNLAHTQHDPRSPELVALWCPACHARHDAPHAYAMTRRSRARRVGQLWLLPEIEWAPFVSWMIPARVLKAGQWRLF
jgi:hypothetical protein